MAPCVCVFFMFFLGGKGGWIIEESDVLVDSYIALHHKGHHQIICTRFLARMEPLIPIFFFHVANHMDIQGQAKLVIDRD